MIHFKVNQLCSVNPTSDIRPKYFFAHRAAINQSLLAAALAAQSLSKASRPTVLIVEHQKQKQNR